MGGGRLGNFGGSGGGSARGRKIPCPAPPPFLKNAGLSGRGGSSGGGFCGGLGGLRMSRDGGSCSSGILNSSSSFSSSISGWEGF